jgi:hypothetical protein
VNEVRERENIDAFKKLFETYGSKVAQNLLSAFLIWLFGNLVFIPLAASLNWQTTVFCSLIFFAAFTALILRAFPGFRTLIDAFSIFPAKKYFLRRGLSYEDSLVASRQLLYIISAVVLYLLYFPFLMNFHPAISGIVLILVLVYIFFLALRILLVSSKKILEWLLK